MNKRELAAAIAERSGRDKRDVEAVLNEFVSTVTDTVASGEPVVLTGFAKFVRVERGPADRPQPPDRGAGQGAGEEGRPHHPPQGVQGRRRRRQGGEEGCGQEGRSRQEGPRKKAVAKKAAGQEGRPAKKAVAKKAPAKKAVAKKAPAKKATARR